jgi:histidine triad (HIT) family protein
MPTIFSKIINGEIPCYKIAENDEFLAFLDISPLEKGHTLIVPKKEIDYITVQIGTKQALAELK